MTVAVPSAVEPYLADVVTRLREILGDDLVGVYAGGSYALGAYEPGRSDLDVATVVAAAPSRATREAVVAALRHESLPCPARGLELVVYPADAVATPSVEPGFVLNLNTGAEMPFRAELAPNGGATHWFPIDRSILGELGIALAGPPARELFAPLTPRQELPLLLESLRWHSCEAGRADDAVLNACRAWRYAVEQVWSSKQAAGAWALAQPGAPPVVADALRARHGDGALDPIAADAALRTARRKIERALAEASS